MPPMFFADQVPSMPQYSCVHDLLKFWAEYAPDAPAILALGRASLTYSRLYQHIGEVVRRLQGMGLGSRDRVALALPNGPEMAVASLAVAAGMTCVPLNPAYSASEFDFYLSAMHPKALLVPQGLDSPVYASARAHGIRVIELVYRLEAEAGLFKLMGAERPSVIDPPFAAADDIALVLHTSGTTSRPKIVPLTHTNICTAAHNLSTALQLVQSDCCLNILPLFHTYGLISALLTSLAAGASTVCLPGFDASQFFAWLEAFRPTWYQAVPAMYHEILAQAAQHRESIACCPLRFMRSGTAPLPQSVRSELESVFNIPLLDGWGMVEASGPIACEVPSPHQHKTGSVGMAIGTALAIMDEHATLLPTGEIGDIVVKGATVMKGYADDPAANRRAFARGWLRSGDAGYLDADGYLFITGRMKEIINRGGENIAPQEVDNVLLEHPAVARAATFAVPHVRLGEDIAAAIVLHQHASATASDIRQFAAARLAAFKVPLQMLIVDDIPQDPATGKIQRHVLAKHFALTAHDRRHPGRPAPAVASPTAVEKTLTTLWKQLLGVQQVGLHDNFAYLGGDSILATQLISRLRDVMHVEVSYLTLFAAPTIAGMASSIAAVSQTTPNSHPPPLQPVPRDRALPLSYAQQRLWFLDQLQSDRCVYNLPLAWRFMGDLNVMALEQSLREMISRHEILRTTFPSVDGLPVQAIVPNLTLSLTVVDLQQVPAAERDRAIQGLAKEGARRPFDLTHGPLMRATLLRFASNDHGLLLTCHHIIFDAWSAKVFWRELATLYTALCSGQPASLPALSLQYTDFALWQRQWLQGDVLTAQLAYWQKQLGDRPPVLHLPTDRPRPPIQTFRGAQASRMLPSPLIAALKALSQQEGVTLFMTLMATFQALLFRYTGQTDLMVGTPIAGRSRVELEEMLGFFVNMLVLRTTLEGNLRFRELLRRVRDVALSAYDYQELPFEKLVDVLQPERDLSYTPLVQVVLALQQTSRGLEELPALKMRSVAVDCPTAKFELTLSLRETNEGLLGTLEYATDLFDAATVSRMLGHFQTLLEGVVDHPEQRLIALPLLTAAERQQLLADWNATATVAQDKCIHHLFETQAARMPNTVAAICERRQLTYSALNQQANQLADYLQTLGVGPEVCVGLCVERSLEIVVGLLGILKAGGAYVPIDPTYPKERIAFMLTDAQVPVLLTQQKLIANLPDHAAHVVCLDTAWARMAQLRAENPVSGVAPENLAYVMYTSGSTGEPKGVMIEHRQALAFLYGFERIAPGGASCIGTAVCPFGFDVSVWEFFSTLCFGGTLHIVLPDIVTTPEHFTRYLIAYRITSAYIPPALLADVADQLEQHHDHVGLKRILVGVEPIKQATLQRLQNLSKTLRIVNGYGPTETTVCATLFCFREATAPERRTPIGTPVLGYDVYLVDANAQPVPIGIPGELLIGGLGLARGYLNRPELTMEKFIPHLFGATPGARLYKSGDLARYLPDGTLEFLGRFDQQVKVRGYRIELEEVEAALRQHPAVQEMVILAREDTHLGNTHLVAYLVSHQEPPPSAGALRHFLKQKLPEYMIPSAFVVLETLPWTSNGKIDHQKLPMPKPVRQPLATAFIAPRTTTERTLSDIWMQVLGLERLGIHDNFFELGGDSIRSIQIIAKANQAGLLLNPKQIFQYQTIAQLAAVASRTSAFQAEQGVVMGLVPLTPNQQRFFEQMLPNPHSCSQVMLLETKRHLNAHLLETIVSHLLQYHDILRVRFTKETSGWRQYITAFEESRSFSMVDLSALPEVQQDTAIEALAETLQACLDLVQGPLLRVVFFDLGSHQPTRLLVIIHDLVADGISWRILLEDLELAYRQIDCGQEIELGPKTTAFKHWAERLIAYAHSTRLWHEQSYWLAASRSQRPLLPVDQSGGANTVASARTVMTCLSSKETYALLQEVPHAYQTRIEDVILTALVQAFVPWTGVSTLLVDLEDYGREAFEAGIDLSHTVGRCTTIFPVLVQIDQDSQPDDALKSVKEQLRSIPNRGIGYGVLRYLSPDMEISETLRSLPQPEVYFRYQDQSDQMPSGSSALFGTARKWSGMQPRRCGGRYYLLEINGYLVEGQLQLVIYYSASIHRRRTIEALAQGFMKALHNLIMYCQSSEAGGYTPSDFPYMKLSQQELDDLISALDEPAEGD